MPNRLRPNRSLPRGSLMLNVRYCGGLDVCCPAALPVLLDAAPSQQVGSSARCETSSDPAAPPPSTSPATRGALEPPSSSPLRHWASTPVTGAPKAPRAASAGSGARDGTSVGPSKFDASANLLWSSPADD
eukprot:2463233-Prymnesium_polylepis.1